MGGNVASGKVVLTRFETGDAVYTGVVTAGVQVSTSNKMVGKARQIP